MFKVSIGSVEITPLLDTRLLMNPQMFIPKYADDFVREFGHLGNERGLHSMAITCYLVRSAGKSYLVDSGLGNRRRPNFPVGRLDEALVGAGLTPGDIDVVLNTHLHIDHVGWNTIDRDDGSKEIFFPRAQFWFQQVEWDHWMQPGPMADPGNAYLVECVEPLRNTGRITFVEGEKAIDENLTYVSTPGHTPGHVSIGIMAGGERAVIVGDASHHPMQLLHPDWSPSFDSDPVQSAKTRERLFDWAIDEQRTWLAGHWEHPGVGRLLRLEGKRTFQSAAPPA
jgi:glyoxylase-like metal-dependent hydrolase (beta-lactamase superfamily II)